MRERLRLLGGTLLAGPRDGEWAVTADLPLPSLAAQAAQTMAAEPVPARPAPPVPAAEPRTSTR
jgi:hypothetical protein